MTCCRVNAVAAASAAFLAIVDLGSASPVRAAELHNHLSASVPLAYLNDGSRSDTISPAAEALTRRSATGFVAPPPLPRLHGPSERPESGCGWSPSRLCGRTERIGGVPVADGGKHAAAAGMGRLEPVLASPPGTAAPYKVTKIAAVSGQLSLPAPESFGRVPTVANAPPARPSGSGEMSFGSSGPHVNEETAPGPYAMLFIGLSLAAFMAFRRVADL